MERGSRGAAAALAALMLLVAAAACTPTSNCSPGYDDSITGYEFCKGSVITSHGSSCGKAWDRVVVDCAATGEVCVAGQSTCAQPCTRDADCSGEEYCSPVSGSFRTSNGQPACAHRLSDGADCTVQPTACATGLVCATTSGSTTMSCQIDCARVDQTAPRCPSGVKTACVGAVAYACDSCGVASVVVKDCGMAPDAANVCVSAGGTSFCAVSTSPDPACGGGVDAYCNGNALVDCFDGFATARIDCSPGACVDNGTRCSP
jgi:hypothetical protein